MQAEELKQARIILRDRGYRQMNIPITGVTELIMDSIGERIPRNDGNKLSGESAQPSKHKSLDDQFLDSMYYDEEAEKKLTEFNSENKYNQWLFPASAARCVVTESGARIDTNINMTQARSIITVPCEWMVIESPFVHMREDWIKNQKGHIILKARAGFPTWRTVFPIRWKEHLLSFEQLINLVAESGESGIGAWRPCKSPSGWAGMFAVDIDRLEKVNRDGYKAGV